MILGLDHVAIAARGPEGQGALALLLGGPPAWRWREDGVEGALFQLANLAVEVLAPAGPGGLAQRLQARLDEAGEGLASLAFRVDDITRAQRRAANVGLAPEAVAEGRSQDVATGAVRAWRRTRLADAATAGEKTFLIAREGADLAAQPAAGGAVEGLDHVVIRTPSAARALAHYGARLGLDLRLDRAAPEWGGRLLFFRAGDLVVEIAAPLQDAADPGPDTLWGLSWRVGDVDAAHARLSAAGLDVSDVRTGRKPGTRVFTVRNGTVGVPTLFLSAAPSQEP